MKKYFYLLIGFISMLTQPALSTGDYDSFEYDNFAISDNTAPDLTSSSVFLNPDADVANVGGFDIADIMLGMTFDEVYTQVVDFGNLYSLREKNAVIYTIQPDWKSNLDYECRQQGTVIPSDLEKCINTMAQNRGLLYASELHLVRENTGETIVVYFTSNATDNVVWRVVYNNDANVQDGSAEKFAKQRENKILYFWQNVIEKYGAPNSGSDRWISSTNSYDPMMIAYYGALDLVDNGRNATDYAKNIQYARENFAVKPYAF